MANPRERALLSRTLLESQRHKTTILPICCAGCRNILCQIEFYSKVSILLLAQWESAIRTLACLIFSFPRVKYFMKVNPGREKKKSKMKQDIGLCPYWVLYHIVFILSLFWGKVFYSTILHQTTFTQSAQLNALLWPTYIATPVHSKQPHWALHGHS